MFYFYSCFWRANIWEKKWYTWIIEFWNFFTLVIILFHQRCLFLAIKHLNVRFFWYKIALFSMIVKSFDFLSGTVFKITIFTFFFYFFPDPLLQLVQKSYPPHLLFIDECHPLCLNCILLGLSINNIRWCIRSFLPPPPNKLHSKWQCCKTIALNL